LSAWHKFVVPLPDWHIAGAELVLFAAAGRLGGNYCPPKARYRDNRPNGLFRTV